MHIQYGNYSFPDNQANLVSYQVQPLFSRRQYRYGARHRFHVQFEFVTTETTTAAAQSDIQDQIQPAIEAFSYDDMDIALYRDDNTVTQHRLQTNHPDALTPVKVVFRSWPTGGPDQFATVRTGYVILEQDYLEPDSQILEYVDTVRLIGDGLHRIIVRQVLRGRPRPQITNLWTNPRIIQQGQALGLQGYVAPPPALFPQFFRHDISETLAGYPESTRKKFVNWPSRWKYVMDIPSPMSAGGVVPQIVY